MRPASLIAFAAIALSAAGCASTTSSSTGSAPTPNPEASASFASRAAALRSAQASLSSALASAASPSPQAPTKVEFIVTGSAPDGVDITYGPSGSNFAGPSVLRGKAVMSVKFDPSASYYALNAQLQGAGSIRCKIVVTGPGDQPLTVSHGAASGGYNICSAQAAPADSSGLNWQNEN
jgi:hypothetical protein